MLQFAVAEGRRGSNVFVLVVQKIIYSSLFGEISKFVDRLLLFWPSHVVNATQRNTKAGNLTTFGA